MVRGRRRRRAPLAQLVSGVDWTRSADWHDGVRWLEWALARREALPASRCCCGRSTSMAAASSPAGPPAGTGDARRAGDRRYPTTSRCRQRPRCWSGTPPQHRIASDPGAPYARRGRAAGRGRGERWRQRAAPPWRLVLRAAGRPRVHGPVDARSTWSTSGPSTICRAALDATTRPRADTTRSRAPCASTSRLSVLVRGEAAEALRGPPTGQPRSRSCTRCSAPSQDSVRILALAALERVDEARERLVAAHDLVQRIDISRGRGAGRRRWRRRSRATVGDWPAASTVARRRRGRPQPDAPITTFLYFSTREKVRRALPVDRCRALRDEGKALGADRALAELLG